VRWLVIAVALFACGGKKKQKRTGDAAPVVIVPTPQFDGGAAGTSSDEIEPNDSADVATPLPLGATMRGKIDPETDADYYRVEVTQAGALTVLTSMADADLTVDVEDASGNPLAKSDRGAARVREGVPNVGVNRRRKRRRRRRRHLPRRPSRTSSPRPSRRSATTSSTSPTTIAAPRTI